MSKKKIVLAYSGGLDTSIILKWLQENYDAEVISYTADIGQKIDRKKILKNARTLGVRKIIIEDLKDLFVKDYIYPMLRGHAIYEGVYLLGTSIARPLIAKRQIDIAKKYKAYAVSHGSTGKGNDQVRFELGYHYFNPKIKVIAPWREWKLNSRTDLIKYAKKNNIPVPKDKKGAPPFSVDDNLYHTSTEGKVLENPKNQAPEFIFQRTTSPEKAPDKASYIAIEFKNGNPVSINNKKPKEEGCTSGDCMNGHGTFTSEEGTYKWKGEQVYMPSDTFPLGWTRTYGSGKVFVTLLGHNGLSFQTPEFQKIVLNGVDWVNN